MLVLCVVLEPRARFASPTRFARSYLTKGRVRTPGDVRYAKGQVFRFLCFLHDLFDFVICNNIYICRAIRFAISLNGFENTEYMQET